MAWVTLDNPPLDVAGALDGVRVTDVAGRNLPSTWRRGTGRLGTDGAGQLRWRAPRSTAWGAWVDCSAGGTFTLTDGADADRWVEVAVTAESLPTWAQEASLELAEQPHNAVAGVDQVVGTAETSTYDFELVNRDPVAAKTLLVFMDMQTTRWLEISANGVDNWLKPPGAEVGLELTLPAGGSVTVYCRRTVPSATEGSPGKRIRIRWTAEDGTIEQGEARGWFRVVRTAEYRVYRRDGAAPDPATEAAWATLASLPGTVDEVLADGDWRFALTRFNGAAASPGGRIARLVLTGGVEAQAAPRAPTGVALLNVGGGVVRVLGRYAAAQDGDAAADQWALWVRTGETPSWAGDPDYLVTVYAGRGYALLAYDLPAAAHETRINVRVRMRRTADGGESATYGEATILADALGPAAVAGIGVRPGSG